MTNGPLPPHERSWRHPSELPGPPPEPATRGGRMLIVAVGTVGLVLVGVLALTMTPDRAEQAGDAVATTALTLLAPSVVSGDVTVVPPATIGATVLASTTVLLALGATSTEPRATVAVSARTGGERQYGAPTIAPATAAAPAATAPAATAPATTAPRTTPPPTDDASSIRMASDPPPVGAVDTAVADRSPATIADTAPGTAAAAVLDTSPTTEVTDTVAPARIAPAFPLVTPVGPNGLAITTHAACSSCTRGSMSATLPSGSVVGVQVIDPDGRFVVVSLPADAGYSAMSVADTSRPPSSMSVMYDGVYTPIDPDSTGALCAPEAAPVLDDHGGLVGLCTASDEGASIVPLDSLPPLPTPSTPATDVSIPASDAATTTTASSTTTTLAATTTAAPSTVATTTVAPR